MPDDGKADLELGTAAELAELFPAPETITVAGRAIEIKRCGIAQAGRMLSIGLPLYAAWGGDFDPLALFDERPEETTRLIAAATGLEAEWVAGLESVDRFRIAAEWTRINAAFFIRRLLPALSAYVVGMNAILAGGGRTSSATSLATATPARAITRPPSPDVSPTPSNAPSAGEGESA